MPFMLTLQRWKTSKFLVSFSMILLDPLSSTYEVLSVSAMKLDGVRHNFASGLAFSAVTVFKILSRVLILSLLLRILVLTYLR